jgi:hypothetical protein
MKLLHIVLVTKLSSLTALKLMPVLISMHTFTLVTIMGVVFTASVMMNLNSLLVKKMMRMKPNQYTIFIPTQTQANSPL